VVTLKVTDVSEVRTASIVALMMEEVRTSEMSVNFSVTTWRYMPEDSKLNSKRSLWVFENKVLRKIFRSERENVAGSWIQSHNGRLHNVYSSPYIIRMVR
jgi:hypothetical protein